MKTKTVIIKFYLLSFLISITHYFQEKINILFQNYNNKSNDNISLDIYKSFLFLPFKKYFEFLSRKIFKRQKLKIQNIFYKNYYLVELGSDQIIFSIQSLYNINSEYGEGGSKYQFKIHKKDQIWKEILFHCHALKNNYMNKYSLNFNELNYQKYYAILQLKSTFPRRTFFIKFLPILNGLALIHEYVQIKLASIKGDENVYKECESIYGFKEDIKNQNDKNNNRLIFLKNEPLILKKVHLFFIESFLIKVQSLGLFNGDKRNNIYFCQEIMDIINRHIVSLKNYNILKNIEKALYEEYLEIINTKANDYEINSNNNLILKNINDNSSSTNDIYNIDEDNSQKLSLNINKKFILMTLFDKEFNLEKDNSNIRNSFSQKNFNIHKDNNIIDGNKKFSNSKKDVNKLSEILNQNISDYTSTFNIYKNHKTDENNYNDNIENNSFKTNNIYNIFDSNILFNNAECSIIKEDLFKIDISNIRHEEKKTIKISNLQYKNNHIELQNNKKNKNSLEDIFNKSTKKQDNYGYDYENSGLDYLGSKEEFLEGEIMNKVK